MYIVLNPHLRVLSYRRNLNDIVELVLFKFKMCSDQVIIASVFLTSCITVFSGIVLLLLADTSTRKDIFNIIGSVLLILGIISSCVIVIKLKQFVATQSLIRTPQGRLDDVSNDPLKHLVMC